MSYIRVKDFRESKPPWSFEENAQEPLPRSFEENAHELRPMSIEKRQDELPMTTIASKQNKIPTLANAEELKARHLLEMQIARIENDAKAEELKEGTGQGTARRDDGLSDHARECQSTPDNGERPGEFLSDELLRENGDLRATIAKLRRELVVAHIRISSLTELKTSVRRYLQNTEHNHLSSQKARLIGRTRPHSI